MKKLLIIPMLLIFTSIITISGVHATLFYEPNIANVVIELDFNYPSTNYVYYGHNGVSFNETESMSTHIYDNSSRRYDFINYLWDLKDVFAPVPSVRAFVADIYLPQKRTFDGTPYSLEWGWFSYNAFDSSTPTLLHYEFVYGYTALKFVYRDIPAEDREVLDMYVIDSTGQIYDGVFENGAYAQFNRNYFEPRSEDFNLFANIKNMNIEYTNAYYEGYNDARIDYGYYNGIWWITAEQYGDIRFDEGYDVGYDEGFDDGELVGINTSQGEAYDKGYLDGSNDSFLASIKDWIVPAIIVVLFLGGALTIISRKPEG